MEDFNKLIVTLVVLLSTFTLTFSQDLQGNINQEKESDGYLVYFEPDVSQKTIDSIMNRYNSQELWVTTYSKVRYWKVIDFPFTVDDSSFVYDMDDLNDVWINDGDDTNHGKKSKVGSYLFNYKIRKENPDLSYENNQNNGNDDICEPYFIKTNTGNQNIIINILDTGFDFQNLGSSFDGLNIINGYNFVNNNPVSQDNNGHGTHITSIIGSLTNTESISVIETKTHDEQGLGKLSDIVRAIDYSIETGTNIINASWSFYATENKKETPLQVAIRTAGQYGILFVTAAGNDGIDNDNNTLKAYPASYPNDNILVVSSNACDSTLSVFSNYGQKYSDVCAIGENIPGIVLNNQMVYMSGTSQATAYVSAMASIIGSYMDLFDPIEVKRMILDGAKQTTKLNDFVLTEAVVDIDKSLSLLNQNSGQIIINDAININNTEKENIVFPNPFIDYITFNIESSEKENSFWEIYDISGKLIKSGKIKLVKGQNQVKINNLIDLKAGIYIIRSKNIFKKLYKTM